MTEPTKGEIERRLRRARRARRRGGGGGGGTFGDVVRGDAEYSGPSVAELWSNTDDETDTLGIEPSELSETDRAAVGSYPKALHKWVAAGAPEGEGPVLAYDGDEVHTENVERWLDADVSTNRRPTL